MRVATLPHLRKDRNHPFWKLPSEKLTQMRQARKGRNQSSLRQSPQRFTLRWIVPLLEYKPWHAEPISSRGNNRMIPDASGHPDTIGERYFIEGELARGGMGTILRAVDRDLRRE